MTDLADKAADSRDVVRVSEATDVAYRLETETLEPAENVGNADFPKYGDFADVVAVDANRDDLGPRWLEVPGDLAGSLVEAGVEAGDVFVIDTAEKTDDGAWTTSVRRVSDEQETL